MPNRTQNQNMNQDPRETSNRAQPGDVLGVENEGKRTHLGADAEDENEELEDVEEKIADQQEDQ